MHKLIGVAIAFVVTFAPTLPVIPARAAHAFTIFGDFGPSVPTPRPSEFTTASSALPGQGGTPPGQAKKAEPGPDAADATGFLGILDDGVEDGVIVVPIAGGGD